MELSVNDTIDTFISTIAERYVNEGWSYLKSRSVIKKTVGDVVFEIRFHSSKWNSKDLGVDVDAECSIQCKTMGKLGTVHSRVTGCDYKSANTESGYWDISRKDGYAAALDELSAQIEATVIPAAKMFEEDFDFAVKRAAETGFINPFDGKWQDFRIEFIDRYAGREYAVIAARNFYEHLFYNRATLCEDIAKYRAGESNKSWMINPCDLKYFVDNEFDKLLNI